MTYHYHGIDAEKSILTKRLPHLGTWALPSLFFIIYTRVTEVSLPKWSLGSPHSDMLMHTFLACCSVSVNTYIHCVEILKYNISGVSFTEVCVLYHHLFESGMARYK